MKKNPSRQNKKVMSSFDWSAIQFFQEKEFRSDELALLNPFVIENLDEIRKALGVAIIPSPAPGAIARSGQSRSQHTYSLDPDDFKLSQAIDVFLPDLPFDYESLTHAIHILTSVSDFRGLGLYFGFEYHGEQTFLMHLDLREKPAIWQGQKTTDGTVFFYPEVDPKWQQSLDFRWNKLRKYYGLVKTVKGDV